MKIFCYTLPILLAFFIVTTVGVLTMLPHGDHSTVCPIMPDDLAICATTFLKHINHWQGAFASIVLSLFVLLLSGWRPRRFRPDQALLGIVRARLYQQINTTPTIFEELFAQGILHRRAP